MTAAETIAHVVRDERGVAWIRGANMKVIELIAEHLAYGWSADELQEQHPTLSLGQIHSALAFFYDHLPEFEAEMARQDEQYIALRTATGEAPLQRRLRAMKRGQ